MIIKKGVIDEVFLSQDIGIKVDIAALIDYINCNFDAQSSYECETSKLMGLNRADDVNYETLSEIGEERLNQPVLVAEIDSHEWIIDGNHRLLRRHELGMKMTRYIPIDAKQLDPFVSEFSWH